VSITRLLSDSMSNSFFVNMTFCRERESHSGTIRDDRQTHSLPNLALYIVLRTWYFVPAFNLEKEILESEG
jgi:hypothetical protein